MYVEKREVAEGRGNGDGPRRRLEKNSVDEVVRVYWKTKVGTGSEAFVDCRSSGRLLVSCNVGLFLIQSLCCVVSVDGTCG